jgi:predicted HicB family RNase H-like nuclease
MIEYKGYIGAVDFDPEIDLFHGTVINTNDVITFYGASVTELRAEMQKSIEGYLEFCTEQGITPEKPFSGEFTIQMSPEMHCKLALNAERLNLDFNVYLQEVLEKAVFSLEKYLLKSNLPESDVEWTIDMVRNSLSQELRAYYEKTYPEEKLNLYYGGVAEVQNLIENEEWGLNPPKFSKMLCGFWLTNKGTIGNIKRIFGILPEGRFPVEKIVGKDGELIEKVQALPRIFVRITKEEAEQLERQNVNLDGCKFYGVQKDKTVDYVYYDIPENMSDLFPVLEFAYKKHSGS